MKIRRPPHTQVTSHLTNMSENSTCIPPSNSLDSPAIVIISLFGFSSMVVSSIANGLTLVTFMKTKSLHSPSNVLLANMAVGDLLLSFPGFPVDILPDYVNYLYCNSSYMTLRAFVMPCLLILTFHNVQIVGLERFIAIEFPYKYVQLDGMKFSVLLSAGSFVLAVTQGLILCFLGDYTDSRRAFITYLATFCTLTGILTTAIYIRIYKVTRRHLDQDRKSGIDNSKDSKAMTSVVTACFYVISWVPSLAVTFAVIGKANIGPWGRLSVSFLQLGTCFNIGIYSYRMAEFRNAIKAMLREKVINRGRVEPV